jgi:hypothetical protein
LSTETDANKHISPATGQTWTAIRFFFFFFSRFILYDYVILTVLAVCCGDKVKQRVRESQDAKTADLSFLVAKFKIDYEGERKRKKYL